jgi:hypothetical protein
MVGEMVGSFNSAEEGIFLRFFVGTFVGLGVGTFVGGLYVNIPGSAVVTTVSNTNMRQRRKFWFFIIAV